MSFFENNDRHDVSVTIAEASVAGVESVRHVDPSDSSILVGISGQHIKILKSLGIFV